MENLPRRPQNKSTTALVTKTFPWIRVPGVVSIYAIAFAFLGLTVLGTLYTGVSLGVLLRDPVATLGGHPLVGVQSHLGVLIWFSGGIIALFCAFILRDREQFPLASSSALTPVNGPSRQSSASFLLSFGLISLWLALDDLFVIHEYVADGILDVSQTLLYALYAVIALWQIVRFRKHIWASRKQLIFVAAIVFFGLSVVTDIFQEHWISPWRIFFEDGCKLLGIVSWSSYFFYTGVEILVRHLGQGNRLQPPP